MSLTKQHIEDWRGALIREGHTPEHVDELCDAALAGIGREWRPIAEAPKDGTAILVPTGSAIAPKSVCIVKWVANDGCWWSDGNSRMTPSVFMPLPDPPR